MAGSCQLVGSVPLAGSCQLIGSVPFAGSFSLAGGFPLAGSFPLARGCQLAGSCLLAGNVCFVFDSQVLQLDSHNADMLLSDGTSNNAGL